MSLVHNFFFRGGLEEEEFLRLLKHADVNMKDQQVRIVGLGRVAGRGWEQWRFCGGGGANSTDAVLLCCLHRRGVGRHGSPLGCDAQHDGHGEGVAGG